MPVITLYSIAVKTHKSYNLRRTLVLKRGGWDFEFKNCNVRLVKFQVGELGNNL